MYDELRQLAAAKLAHEKPGQTLQATALVHEAYLRLIARPEREGEPPAELLKWDSRGHFFGAAAEAMRRIIVDQARHKATEKAGGNFKRVELSAVEPEIEGPTLDILCAERSPAEAGAERPAQGRASEAPFLRRIIESAGGGNSWHRPLNCRSGLGVRGSWLHVEMSGGIPLPPGEGADRKVGG